MLRRVVEMLPPDCFDEATFALVAACGCLKHSQGLFIWNPDPTSSLDDSKHCLYWAELGVVEVLVIRLDLKVSILLLFLDEKLEIKNIIHCEICQVVQWLFVFVEEIQHRPR